MSTQKQMSQMMENWKAATPIGVSRMNMADRTLLEKYKVLRDANFITELGARITGGEIKNAEIKNIIEDAKIGSELASDERAAIDEKLNQVFFRKLWKGEIRCFGFESPRQLNSEPVEMTYDDFTHYPDWKKGEFKAYGLHLIELRILDGSVKPTQVKPADRGRPSFRDEIISAYNALKSDNRLPDGPMTHCFPLINEWIQENRPSSKAAQQPNGVSDKTIGKTLREYLS